MRPLKRAIHLDFHTLPGIYNFNEGWDAAAFAQRLQDAHVKYINAFAKCNTGFCYYPTKIGTPYPGMKGDMFGDLLRECHKRDIGVSAYFNIGFDHEGCRTHIQWSKVIRSTNSENYEQLAINTIWPEHPWANRYTCFNTGFGDYLKDLLREFLSMYPDVDGLFFDCLHTAPCSCNACLEEIQAAGGNPLDPDTLQKHTIDTNYRFCMELKNIVGEGKYILCNSLPDWDVKDFNTHSEVECLTPGGWNYEFFAAQAAYARTIKKDILYMNGRFQKDWGDFGGFKEKAAIENDMWDAVSNGLGCSIGDHMHPAEILDENVYRVVGEVYKEMEKLEPWTDGAVYQADIGILVAPKDMFFIFDGPFASVCRMLGELKYTYNMVNDEMDFSPYKLLILPDQVRLNPLLTEKLDAYLKAGGKVLTTGNSGLLENEDRFALPEFWPMKVTGRKTHDKTYYKLTDGNTFRYNMYAPTLQTDVPENSEVLAWQVMPYFEEDWDGFFAYRYNPPEKEIPVPAALRIGNVCHISFDVFTAYSERMYPAHRALTGECIRRLLTEPCFTCEGIPSTARVTLTTQNHRKMIHVKTTFPEIRGKYGIIEEHVFLPAGAKVTLQGEYSKVYTAPDQTALPFVSADGKTTVTLPQIHGYLLVVAE